MRFANKWGRTFYRLRYRIGEYFLKGFVVVFPWLPPSLLAAFTRLAAQLSFFLLWKYRQRMEKNLSLVMGDEFPRIRERRALVRSAWRNFAQGIFETACSLYTSKEAICSTVAIRGEEHLKRSLARGKGVIGLSAHLGNFTMIGPRLAAAGYTFSVVVKQPRHEGIARLIDSYRAKVGVKTISAKPRREAARQILRALRKNDVVLLIADEFKSTGVEVEFLGRLVPAPRGPVTLALRTGAALVPMFLTRDREDRLTLQIGSELDLIQTGILQKDVTTNVTLSSRCLETMVRRYPDQWNWLGFHKDGKKPKKRNALSKSRAHSTNLQDDRPSPRLGLPS